MSTMPLPWNRTPGAPASPGAPGSPEASARRFAPVASTIHTVVLIAFLAVLTGLGAYRQHEIARHAASATAAAEAAAAAQPASAAQVIPLYLSLLAGEWALVAYVWRAGLRRAGVSAKEIVGGRWASARDVVRDAVLGVALWGTWALVAEAWTRLAGSTSAASGVSAYLPHGAVESTLWIAVSVSAGICEEFVFRGYLMRQFLAWTRLPWLALVLQAVVFGVSHGYQGVEACARIAAFGVLFGALAWWRQSLRPGMIAHALTDVVAGLLRV